MLKNKFKLLALIFIQVLFFSCTKNSNDNLDQNEKFEAFDPLTQAEVKFVHAYTPLTLNGGSTTAIGLRLLMNGNKVNGSTNISSLINSLIYGGIFPATAAYSFLNAGSQNIKFVMNRITSGNFAPLTGDEIFNDNLTFDKGKKYSIFLADPYPSPGVFMIEDNYQKPGENEFGLRFINLCGDVTSRFDLVSARQGVLFSDVGNKEIKNYVYLTISQSLTDTLQLRLTGTTNIVSQVNSFNAGKQRVYTFYARGKTGVTGRTPGLTFYTNR